MLTVPATGVPVEISQNHSPTSLGGGPLRSVMNRPMSSMPSWFRSAATGRSNGTEEAEGKARVGVAVQAVGGQVEREQAVLVGRQVVLAVAVEVAGERRPAEIGVDA